MKRFEGKLFGAALGFSFGGPIGALIGAVVGHLFDTSIQSRTSRLGAGAQKELTFITSLILLLTGTAKADGTITTSEIHTIENFFYHQLGYQGNEFRFIQQLVRESTKKEINVAEVCAEISKKTTYEERLFLIQLNYQVALADGVLSRAEDLFIKESAQYLHIESYDFTMIRNSFVSSSHNSGSFQNEADNVSVNSYSVLGISTRSSNEEVHTAYRSLANKYHPDKVSHLGKEFIELANRKFAEIQNAYETIKKQRGMV